MAYRSPVIWFVDDYHWFLGRRHEIISSVRPLLLYRIHGNGLVVRCLRLPHWTKESELDVVAEDFDQESGEVGERVPRFKKLSDHDGDLHIVADPSERDADEWRVFAIREDGSRKEIGRTEFWSTGFGEHEGRPGWYAEGFDTYDMEIEMPGRSTPYRTSSGRNLQMYESLPLGSVSRMPSFTRPSFTGTRRARVERFPMLAIC